MKAHTEELVWIESEDGIRLDGVVIWPSSGKEKSVAVVQVHGFTARFSHPVHVLLGRELASRGYVSISGNNRGFAFGETTYRQNTGEPVVIGGAWERFQECPYDVGAWMSFAEGLGFNRAALLGQSFGAPKAVYYQAQRQDPRVVGLILASSGVGRGEIPAERIALAEQMVEEGRGLELMPWQGTVSLAGMGSLADTLSAQTTLDRAPANWPNFDVYGLRVPDPLVSRVRCPILAFYGSKEESYFGSPQANFDLIRQHATAAPYVDTMIFEGANHAYSGHEAEVAKPVAEWIDRLL